MVTPRSIYVVGFLHLLVIFQPCFGYTAKEREVLDVKTFSKAVYEAIGSLPPQEGYLQIESAGGMTNESAWQWFSIKVQEKSAGEFLKSYLSSINQRLEKAGILTGGPPATGNADGLRTFCLNSPDERITGTISIVIRGTPDNLLTIVVSSAVFGKR